MSLGVSMSMSACVTFADAIGSPKAFQYLGEKGDFYSVFRTPLFLFDQRVLFSSCFLYLIIQPNKEYKEKAGLGPDSQSRAAVVWSLEGILAADSLGMVSAWMGRWTILSGYLGWYCSVGFEIF